MMEHSSSVEEELEPEPSADNFDDFYLDVPPVGQQPTRPSGAPPTDGALIAATFGQMTDEQLQKMVEVMAKDLVEKSSYLSLLRESQLHNDQVQQHFQSRPDQCNFCHRPFGRTLQSNSCSGCGRMTCRSCMPPKNKGKCVCCLGADRLIYQWTEFRILCPFGEERFGRAKLGALASSVKPSSSLDSAEPQLLVGFGADHQRPSDFSLYAQLEIHLQYLLRFDIDAARVDFRVNDDELQMIRSVLVGHLLKYSAATSTFLHIDETIREGASVVGKHISANRNTDWLLASWPTSEPVASSYHQLLACAVIWRLVEIGSESVTEEAEGKSLLRSLISGGVPTIEIDTQQPVDPNLSTHPLHSTAEIPRQSAQKPKSPRRRSTLSRDEYMKSIVEEPLDVKALVEEGVRQAAAGRRSITQQPTDAEFFRFFAELSAPADAAAPNSNPDDSKTPQPLDSPAEPQIDGGDFERLSVESGIPPLEAPPADDFERLSVGSMETAESSGDAKTAPPKLKRMTTHKRAAPTPPIIQNDRKSESTELQKPAESKTHFQKAATQPDAARKQGAAAALRRRNSTVSSKPTTVRRQSADSTSEWALLLKPQSRRASLDPNAHRNVGTAAKEPKSGQIEKVALFGEKLSERMDSNPKAGSGKSTANPKTPKSEPKHTEKSVAEPKTTKPKPKTTESAPAATRLPQPQRRFGLLTKWTARGDLNRSPVSPTAPATVQPKSKIPIKSKAAQPGSPTNENVDPKALNPLFGIRMHKRRIVAMEGQRIRVGCRLFTNSPDVEVNWFGGKRRSLITDSGRTQIRRTKNDRYLEIFDCDSKLDSGELFCVAVGPQGLISDVCEIIVEETNLPPPRALFTQTLSVRQPKPITGDEICMRCRVSGFPQPYVEFYHHGQPLRHGDNAQIDYTEDGNWTLTIPQSNKNSSGKYWAVARNRGSVAKSRADVEVQPPEWTANPNMGKYLLPLEAIDRIEEHVGDENSGLIITRL